MQFIVLVDGDIIGQIEVSDEVELGRVLAKFPTAILRTPAQMIEDGWR
jgi:hypothetical protein